jgi:hypothetical protein
MEYIGDSALFGTWQRFQVSDVGPTLVVSLNHEDSIGNIILKNSTKSVDRMVNLYGADDTHALQILSMLNQNLSSIKKHGFMDCSETSPCVARDTDMYCPSCNFRYAVYS